MSQTQTSLQSSTRRSPDPSSALPAVIIATAVLALWTAGASAQVRTEIPEEDPGPPFYARVERDAVHTDIVPHDEELGALIFYRSPSCTPLDFNLLDLFDPPAAFDCSLTIDGFAIWQNGPPPVDMNPKFARFRGLGAVPVWFVSWPALRTAVDDDVLTVRELLEMPSLKMGLAAFYQENLHPTGGAVRPSLSLTAHGILDSGEVFSLHHSGREAGVQTTIRIRE